MSGNWGRAVGVGEKRQKGSGRSAAAAARRDQTVERLNWGFGSGRVWGRERGREEEGEGRGPSFG